jgi:hypothetical protein
VYVLRAIAVSAVLGGCGGAGGQPIQPPLRGDAGAPEPSNSHAGLRSPTDDECAALVAHAIDLVERERSDKTQLTETDRANTRAQADVRCRAMSRASFTCAQAATTSEALAACDSRDAQ